MLINFNNHPVFSEASDIATICSPLNTLQITYFAHVFIDKNGLFSVICNNPAFLEHYLNNYYYNADIHMASCNSLGNHIIWDTLEISGETDKMNREAIAFGVDHTYTIVESSSKGTHYFHFSTHLPNKSFNQVYLANIDLLNIFIQYFKDTTNKSPALKKAFDITFSLDQQKGKYVSNHVNIPEQDKIHFLNQIKQRKPCNTVLPYIPTSFKKNKELTQRESECLHYLIRGKSASKISDLLHLSKRTVETYLTNIKIKMGVASKAELIERIMDGFYIPKTD